MAVTGGFACLGASIVGVPNQHRAPEVFRFVITEFFLSTLLKKQFRPQEASHAFLASPQSFGSVPCAEAIPTALSVQEPYMRLTHLSNTHLNVEEFE